MGAKPTLATKRKVATKEDAKRRLAANYTEFTGDEFTIKHCWLMFMMAQREKGNSKATMDYYNAFYKKLAALTDGGEWPINMLTQNGFQAIFMERLGDIKQQSKNTYLRAYRAFGNFCERQGILDGFECPIKEIETPIKQVYTEKELKALLVKPDITNFSEYRNYLIIELVLATGARCNTIINIHIEDVDLIEGYINFNTTKAHKVARIGLDRKLLRDLKEYISFWRTSKEGFIVLASDYLFCNQYGEQITRYGLEKAIAKYNKSRGVNKTSIHLLRHTFAKNWITSGGDIITLAKVLTHSELEMVKKYSNLYSEDVKDEIYQHSTLSQLKTTSGKTMVKRIKEDY